MLKKALTLVLFAPVCIYAQGTAKPMPSGEVQAPGNPYHLRSPTPAKTNPITSPLKTGEGPPKKLSLKEAESIALRNAPVVGSAYFNAQAAKDVVKEVRSQFFPQVEGVIEAVGTYNAIRNEFAGTNHTAPQIRIGASGALNNSLILSRESQGFNISQLVFDFGRTANLAAAAQFDALSQAQKAQLVRAQVVYRVDRAYLNVLKAKALLSVAQQTVADRQVILDEITALAQNKLKSDLDLTMAEANLEQAQQLVHQTGNTVGVAFAELSAALGYKTEYRFELSEQQLPPFPKQSLTVRPHWWLFYFLAAFGFRSWAHHGYGNCRFRCSHALGSRSEAQVENGGLTRGSHNGGRPRCGGDLVRRHMCVSVIIPTHNEAQAIARVLADLPSDLISEVIVVDSNSNDGTPELAASLGARVIREPRRGYGRACLTGLAKANSPDIVVFLDGDYSDRPSELPILLDPIIQGHADITLGSRLGKQRIRAALPWHQAFGNRLAASLIRLLYGLRITDLGPFRAGRVNVLRALALEETTYGWAVEMILKGALSGFRVVEVPVTYYPRIGKSKISGTLKGTVGAAWFILSLTVRYYFRQRKTGIPGVRSTES
jgi:hypothetical protein